MLKRKVEWGLSLNLVRSFFQCQDGQKGRPDDACVRAPVGRTDILLQTLCGQQWTHNITVQNAQDVPPNQRKEYLAIQNPASDSYLFCSLRNNKRNH